MDKCVTKIYFAVLLIGILYAVFATVSFPDDTFSRTGDKKVITLDDHMEMTQEGDVYYYKTVLPEMKIDDKTIVYNTVHMNLEVQIDGMKVYELKTAPNASVKTTGFYWNVITLTGRDAGKEIVFQVTPAYSDSKPKGSFYYGVYREVEHQIWKERIVRLVLAAMIALAGIVMLVYGFFVVKKGQDAETIMQFATFAALLGTWSVSETQILDLYFPGSMVIVFLSHLTLMVMPVPFVLYLRRLYHNGESKLWGACCYINCVVIFVRLVLQMAGLYDLRETLLLTHICILLFVALIVAMSIHEVAVSKLNRQTKINTFCVMVILVSTVLELGIYHFSHKSTPLGSVGFLFYIVVMGIENVRKSRMVLAQARESEIYRKLAFTDELTGLPNRTAFKEDLEKRMRPDQTTGEEKILPTVVFMFDLNDLKKCNDTYGHDYGDRYITMAADVLKEIFSQEGKCYRIGGDEFCAWAPYVSLEEINAKLQVLDRYVQGLNEKGFVVTVSIAVGYAIYKEDEDGGGLYSTMKRADAMMYERKQEYKKRKDS